MIRPVEETYQIALGIFGEPTSQFRIQCSLDSGADDPPCLMREAEALSSRLPHANGNPYEAFNVGHRQAAGSV